jgi:hypothetical protein
MIPVVDNMINALPLGIREQLIRNPLRRRVRYSHEINLTDFFSEIFRRRLKFQEYHDNQKSYRTQREIDVLRGEEYEYFAEI